jgi:hypothetical protein
VPVNLLTALVAVASFLFGVRVGIAWGRRRERKRLISKVDAK